MSLKDNFSQAVKDILKKDGLVGDDMSKKNAEKSELDRYLEPNTAAESSRQTPKEAAPATPVLPRPQPPQQQYAETQPVQQPRQQTYQQQSSQSAAQPQTRREAAPSSYSPIESPYHDVEEQTIISRNTIIEGSVRSFANVTLEGSVKGDIQSTKNASISGKLIGNLDCNNASMLGSQMQGSILSKGQVKFDRDSLILGNINAVYLDMNGKVKGNIDINGKAEFKSDAYVIGDINVATLTVLEGATISGHVNTTYLQEAPSNIFPEMISMGDLG
ncbi:MAG: polymer-forming cytoskeletal protein [Oscillospiraceae bacterium]|jgi:cytoskeletal protein CcmA (bactofilin family)